MDYKCYKGAIIAPDENGNQVPVFIQVRDVDIVWTESSFPDELRSIVQSGWDQHVSFLTAEWDSTVNDWRCHVVSDGEFRARRVIDLSAYLSTASNIVSTSSNNEIAIKVDLPLEALNNEDLSISLTMMSNNVNARACVLSTYYISETSFTSMTVSMINNSYEFNKSNLSAIFSNSKLLIDVSGKVNM